MASKRVSLGVRQSCVKDVWPLTSCTLAANSASPCDVWRDSWICVTRFIHIWRDFLYSRRQIAPVHDVWHDSFICVTWLIHTWRNSFIYDGLICMCDMTHSYVHFLHFGAHSASPWRVTCLVHICDMTHPYVWHDSFMWCLAQYRVAKTHRIPYLYRSFSAKEPCI